MLRASHIHLPSRAGKGFIRVLVKLFAFNAMAFCLGITVIAQDLQVLPEWKDHFKTPVVVENCIFERALKNIGGGTVDETNLLQFKYQTNGFMLRQIVSLDEARSNFIPRTGFYAGGFMSNYWAIELHGRIMLFPDAGEMMKARNDGNAALVFGPHDEISSVLSYGINQLDPATVQWLGATTFTGRSIEGKPLTATILETDQKRPTLLEWHFDAWPKVHRFLEYKYDQRLGLAYFPSEMRLYRQVEGKGARVLASINKIFVLETAPHALEESAFSHTNYFRPSSIEISVTVISNQDSYTMLNDGRLDKVLPLSASIDPPGVLRKGESPRGKIFMAAIIILLLPAMFLVWRKVKSSKE